MNKPPPRREVENVGTWSRKRLKFPIFESIGTFCAQTGFDHSLVGAVKKTPEGSKAFLPGNRIDSGVLINAITAQMRKVNKLPPGFSTWKEVREMNEALLSETKRKTAQKLTMLIEDAQSQASKAMALTFAQLERRDRELPPAIEGRSAVEVHERMKADTEQIRETLKKAFEGVGK